MFVLRIAPSLSPGLFQSVSPLCSGVPSCCSAILHRHGVTDSHGRCTHARRVMQQCTALPRKAVCCVIKSACIVCTRCHSHVLHMGVQPPAGFLRDNMHDASVMILTAYTVHAVLHSGLQLPAGFLRNSMHVFARWQCHSPDSLHAWPH
jgi:hypothetical protein